MQRIAILISLLTFSLLTAELVVLAGARLAHPEGNSDPFAPYEAIMPGQPSSTLDTYPCSFRDGGTGTPDCVIYPDSTSFSLIDVSFFDHAIRRTTFVARELYVVDLVARWGHPDTILSERLSFSVYWESGIHALIDPAMQFSYRLRVQVVAIRQIS